MDETLKKKMLEDYDCPVMCKECEGVMVYKGLGEYKCENCGAVEYDEYGKVRNYLDEHRGANVTQISEATGVSHKSIRDMIKENRFAVVDSRGGYIRCEMCGESISSGRLCSKCEAIFHRQVEEDARVIRRAKAPVKSGSAAASQGESGSKRFTYDR
jgi:Adenine-specific DNA methylase containing a Zn-ribbon